MTAIDALATDELQELAHRHLLMHFTRNGAFGPGGNRLLVLERGEGAYVFDTDGKRYLDGLSSLFCCQLGYSFGEEMAAVAGEQLSTLAFNTNWATAHPPAIRLAEALAERAPGDLNRVFFTCGGSESVEAAWKIVRQHYLAKGEPQRTKAIAREIAYHGVTLGALSFTGVRPMKEPFGASPIPVVRVSNTNRFRHELEHDPAAHCAQLLEEMERTIVETGPETVAMIIAEPVQNAGGALVPPEGYWAGLRAIADRYGIALVADEVITGFGRFGEYFASARYGPAPDVITLPRASPRPTRRWAPWWSPTGSPSRCTRTAGCCCTASRSPATRWRRRSRCATSRSSSARACSRTCASTRATCASGSRSCRAGADRGRRARRGLFWALELVRDEQLTRFSAEERERLLRGFLAGRLLEEGLIARPDDRGDAVLHLAPPLICGRRELDELVAKTEAVLADASERFFAASAHDAHGYWLREAGGAEPVAPAAGELDADVVIVGGGYAGMWTAWNLLERGARVVLLEARSAATARAAATAASARRCGRTCRRCASASATSARWPPARRRPTACARSGCGARQQGIDAWFRQAGSSRPRRARRRTPSSTRSSRPPPPSPPGRVVALDADGVRARCDSPRFRRGLFVPDDATVQPARLALGLRRRLLERGVAIYEHSRVRLLEVSGGEVVARTDGAAVRAGAASSRINAATRGVRPLRSRLSVTSSHIVLTEPVPDVLEQVGWTGGESITDGRTFLHYFRTTRDGRIVFGWGGGQLAVGARLNGRIEVDPGVVEEIHRHLVDYFPALRERAITHAWGGPIDVSPSHLPQIGTLDDGLVHYAFGFTGNGVGPSHLAGRVLAGLAAGDGDRSLALDEPGPPVPGEPLAWLGGMAVRAAFLRAERLEAGQRPDLLTRAVCAAPRALGIHVSR